MPETLEIVEDKLLSDMGQVWRERGDNEYYDQYGFVIYKVGNQYHLYRHNQRLGGEVNKLHTAKLLSKIWLNDAVLYKKVGI